nr:IS110 family transposase [Sinorhizobium fredii]
MASFKRGRDSAAWASLFPRRHSPGGKERFGRFSKEGKSVIRQLLFIGAMPCLNWLSRSSVSRDLGWRICWEGSSISPCGHSIRNHFSDHGAERRAAPGVVRLS